MNIDAENNTDIIAPKVRQTQISNETKWLMYLLVLLKYLYKCINETYMFCPFLNLFFFIRRACLMKKIYYLCISRQYKDRKVCITLRMLTKLIVTSYWSVTWLTKTDNRTLQRTTIIQYCFHREKKNAFFLPFGFCISASCKR